MQQRRFAIGTLALVAMALCALPALSSARTAYVTGAEGISGGGLAVPVDLAAAKAGTPVPIASGEGAPPDVAITPDGKTAYVASGNSTIVPIDVATNTAGTPIPAGSSPMALAIAPDGKTAYVADTFVNQVIPVNLVSGVAGTPIPVGSLPFAVAITPDGTRAYVPNLLSNNVSVIDTATNTVVATISVGASPQSVAVTPNGATVYVAEGNGIVPIDVATNTAGTTIPGSGDSSIAISPSGSRAYVVDNNGEVVPVDLGAGSAGSPFAVVGLVADLAFLPDGSHVYAPFFAQTGDGMAAIDAATNAVGTPFKAAENPNAIAIVPNQPPHAAFGSAPAAPLAGSRVSFNAGGSTDPDGSVARYDWSFGDGTSAADAGAMPQHTYAKAGTYQVTLTTTDNEGCSTRLVFTGQTAYCNGSSVATVTHPVVVGTPSTPTPCNRVQGNAATFVPKRRPGNVVPGVRVVLTTSAPAHLAVTARLEWSRKHGSTGNVALGEVAVNVQHWRRIRFAIPDSVRDQLPLGTPVTVHLLIETTPLNHSCTATFTRRELHLHVVKVFPNRVQAQRPR